MESLVQILTAWYNRNVKSQVQLKNKNKIINNNFQIPNGAKDVLVLQQCSFVLYCIQKYFGNTEQNLR